MFGLSFGELMVLLLVAVVVLGPKELPRYLRKAGQLAGKLRRMAFEMREKSGIDEVLRTEGIDRDIAEIRRLARGELTGVMSAVRSTADAVKFDFPKPMQTLPTVPAAQAAPGANEASDAQALAGSSEPLAPVAEPSTPEKPPGTPPIVYVHPEAPAAIVVDRAREYPPEGADSYAALPDTAVVYPDSLPASALAGDALYARGEAA